jgi:putative heme-binding domain-containing protein
MRAIGIAAARAAMIAAFLFGLGSVARRSLGLSAASGQEPQWIWSPAVEGQKPAGGTCYFRRSFDMAQPEVGEVQVAADEAYELYVNGHKAGEGKNWRVMDIHDITKYLVAGRNAVGIKVTKSGSGPAGVAARVLVKSAGDTYVGYFTNDKWKSSQKEFQQWTLVRFNDSQWLAAHAIGQLGVVKPWLDEVQMAGGSVSGRFNISKEFRVEPVADPQETGSLLTMAFNEFGEILASREGGPLLLLRAAKKDGLPNKASIYCDRVSNIQGILPLNGQVFVVGAGPDGTGLYRISDADDKTDDSKIEPDDKLADGKQADSKPAAGKHVDLLIKFAGEMSEHGPHVPVLGPDGLIYVLIGDHTTPVKPEDPNSPHHHYYEGDLIAPRYEDPNGYGVGVKAPGGRILRTDTTGSVVEIFAGGFRNPYGFTFNRSGELFTDDSDMEWDVGLPWYRPTRVLHVVPGGEYGWRSGWAVWPSYFFDSLPSIVDTGRGSPTGMVTYDHVMYPRRFHDSLFVGDWAKGRILNIKLKPTGASYAATSSVFLEGKPLNVTGLAVGPDGSLYFCTGGRGTEGGVYRVVWNGKVPAEMTKFGDGIEGAIRQPQLDSAWTRQRIATIKQQLGDKWDKQIAATAENPKTAVESRLRALELMQLVGPFPSQAELVRLSRDTDVQIRAKVAYLMGLHSDESTEARLIELLHDADPLVERMACEALVRAGHKATWKQLAPLLISSDRYVVWAATRALEQVPKESWQEQALKAENPGQFLQGALALLVVDPDRQTAEAILTRVDALLAGYLSDPDFLDLLRVTELALERGKITGDDVPDLRKKLAKEYPSKDRIQNRELIRLLAYLNDNGAARRMIQQLQTDMPLEEKLHLALYARFIPDWTTKQKLALLKFYESARNGVGGHSFSGYIENAARDLFAGLNEDERAQVLAEGTKWPSSALSVLAKLPDNPGAETLAQLQALDRQLVGVEGEPARKLGIGIVAVLGHSGDSQAMAYLRDIYEKDPDRRGYIAMALAEHPEGENWPILIRSLPIVDGSFAQQVLVKLATVDQTPDGPEPYRQVILRGLKLQENGGPLAVALLEKWTGKKMGEPEAKWNGALAAWQKWFAETYPDQPEAKLPEDSANNRWTYDELFSFLSSKEAARGSGGRGAAVFTKAQCIKCHRFGERGEGVGPDLTTVSRRFQKKEILESILYPSQVISDQYASKSVLRTDGRTAWGIVAPQADGSFTVLQSDATKIRIPKDEIDTITAIKKSAMPEGLLNPLSLEEIADLFAYLNQSAEPQVSQGPGARKSAVGSRQ